MTKRPPIELRQLKPETLSARLTSIHSLMKTTNTKLRNAQANSAVDDFGHTDAGKKLRKELWILKGKLEGLSHWLARIRNDCRLNEAVVRDEKKMKELGVNPEEVLSR